MSACADVTSSHGALALLVTGIVFIAALIAPITLHAQATQPDQAQNENENESESESENQDESLSALKQETYPLRAALHRDPTLDTPLQRLLSTYRDAGQADHLIETYRDHVDEYPQDINGRIVLVRLLRAAEHRDASRALEDALAAHEDSAYLHYLRYASLEAFQPGRALEPLARAVELTDDPQRRIEWIKELLPLAEAAGARELAKKHAQTLIDAAGDGPEAQLTAAKTVQARGFHELALSALQRAAGASPEPQTMVDIELAAAASEAALGRREAAADRLDAVMDKVTIDYWQRPEILRRRIALVRTEEEQNQLIDAARRRVEAHPDSVPAALDLAAVLSGFDQSQAALDVLRKASERRPESRRLEQALLSMFDTLQDDAARAEYLAQRVERFPQRLDLAYEHVKALYLTANGDEAKKRLDALLKKIDEADRAGRLLDLARFLRGSSLPRAAVGIFERVIELAPQRLDVRTEAAEVYAALENAQRERAVLEKPLPEGAPIEHIAALARYMINREMFDAAREAIEPQLDAHEASLELRLMLLEAHGGLEAQQAGMALIEASRSLADTPARYQRWLSGALHFADVFDNEDAVLQAERARQQDEWADADFAWSGGAYERHEIFLDVAANYGSTSLVLDTLETDLERDPPQSQHIAMRRRIVELIGRGQQQQARIEQHLRKLIEIDPDRAGDYRSRIIVMYDREDVDKVRNQITRIEFENVTDASLLDRASNAIVRFESSYVGPIIRRLVELDPQNTRYWTEYLSLLVHHRKEQELRTALRRLLAGIDRMDLSEATRARLRGHLLDSHWRSVARALSIGEPGALESALDTVQRIDRGRLHRDDALWVAWAEARLLHRLGRADERDAAMARFDRIAETPLRLPARHASQSVTGASAPVTKRAAQTAKQAPATQPNQPPNKQPTHQGDDANTEPPSDALAADDRVFFPDGLMMSLAEARRAVKRAVVTPPTRRAPPALKREDDEPMQPPTNVRWAFDTYGSPIMNVAMDGERVYVLDMSGTLYGVDANSGGLQWQRDNVTTVMTGLVRVQTQQRGRTSTEQTAALAPDLKVRNGRVYVPTAEGVTCLDGENGDIVWRARMSLTMPEKARANTNNNQPAVILPRLRMHEDQVIAYDPLGDALASFDAENGRCHWERDYGRPQYTINAWRGAGMTRVGDGLLLDGATTRFVDAKTGKVRWALASSQIRHFPVTLETAEEAKRKAQSSDDGSGQPASAPPQSRFTGNRPPPPHTGPHSISSTRRVPASTGESVQHLPHSIDIETKDMDLRGEIDKRVALVSVPVAWTRNADSYHARVIWPAGDRVWLLSQRFAVQFDPALPWATASTAVYNGVDGVVLGWRGEHVVNLQHGHLSMNNMNGNTFASHSLQKIQGGPLPDWKAGQIHRDHVLVAGGNGLIVANLDKRITDVKHAPWPEMVVPADGETPNAEITESPAGVSVKVADARRPTVPMISRIRHNTWYVAPVPNRLVAIAWKDQDAEEDAAPNATPEAQGTSE